MKLQRGGIEEQDIQRRVRQINEEEQKSPTFKELSPEAMESPEIANNGYVDEWPSRQSATMGVTADKLLKEDQDQSILRIAPRPLEYDENDLPESVKSAHLHIKSQIEM